MYKFIGKNLVNFLTIFLQLYLTFLVYKRKTITPSPFLIQKMADIKLTFRIKAKRKFYINQLL